MAAVAAIILSIITIILLSVFLFRFKKIFSTEKIIEKTKLQMNRMLTDINGNASRNLELIRENTNRLKALLNDADRKMEQFREATQLLRNLISEAEKMNRSTGKTPVFIETKKMEGIKPVGSRSRKSQINPEDSYELAKPQQRSLFDDEKPESAAKSIFDDETTVTPDGAAYRHVPLVITKILDEEPVSQAYEYDGASSPVVQTAKKDFSEQVWDLFNKGLQVEQIAAELSCTVTEVQLIIDMNL